MFEDLMRKYKKDSREMKFNIFYWFFSILILPFSLYFNFSLLFVFILLIIANVSYFLIDYFKIMKNTNAKEKGIKSRIKAYNNKIEKLKFDSIIKLLKQYNIKTKSDLKFAIDYFISEKPIKTVPNLLELIITIFFSLAAFIGVAYNTETKSLNIEMINKTIDSTLAVLLCTLVPILIVKFIIDIFKNPKDKRYTNLINDLSYIYVNFDKFKKICRN